MQFSEAAPGALTPSGGDWVGEWSASASNVGLTQAEVASWVSSALNDAGGWTQVSGLTFDDIGTGGVVFRSVADLPGDAIGTCFYDTSPPHVDLKASFFGNKDLVNHEAAHAFFFATHSPEGSDSMMEPIEDPGEEGASATDVSQVEAWLGGADPKGLAPSLYWHPYDLSPYKTKIALGGFSEVSLSVPVIDALPAGLEVPTVMRAVYSEDPDAPIEDWPFLGALVVLDAPAFMESGFSEITAGAKEPAEVYIGVTIETTLPIDRLEVGSPEIRAR